MGNNFDDAWIELGVSLAGWEGVGLKWFYVRSVVKGQMQKQLFCQRGSRLKPNFCCDDVN